MREVFIPDTATEGNEKRLLILDSHASHQTDEFIFECFRNDIYILFLPIYTSHILQPLDISIFSLLKGRYCQELKASNLYATIADTPIAKAQFLEIYKQAYRAAFTEGNIKAGWREIGLWPISRMKPLRNRMVISSKPL